MLLLIQRIKLYDKCPAWSDTWGSGSGYFGPPPSVIFEFTPSVTKMSQKHFLWGGRNEQMMRQQKSCAAQ